MVGRDSLDDSGRYVLEDEIAAGGMATVHLGRVRGPAGFNRVVAIKRPHPNYAKDPSFVSMFLDEARLTAAIHHPNVVSTFEVAVMGDELWLVMEYIAGESLARLLDAAPPTMSSPKDVRIRATIVADALHGLHAAHEACGEDGRPLGIIHRDVSPQNIIVGVDGVAKVVDFGIAHAAFRLQTTNEGQLKGRLRYMSPERLANATLDRRSDVYAMAVVLWEALVGRHLFAARDVASTVSQILHPSIPPPSSLVPGVPKGLDEVVLRGLAAAPDERFPTALAMAEAIERLDLQAGPREIGAWVSESAAGTLADRAAKLATIERTIVPSPPGSVTEIVSVDRSRPGDDPSFAVAPSTPPHGMASPRRPKKIKVAAIGALVVVVLMLVSFITLSSRRNKLAATAEGPKVEATQAASMAAGSSAPTLALAPPSGSGGLSVSAKSLLSAPPIASPAPTMLPRRSHKPTGAAAAGASTSIPPRGATPATGSSSPVVAPPPRPSDTLEKY